jgi:glycosyltransferase involved in cell wall biosynthesis
MKILVTADPELPVPPRLYGGIERVIALLVDGLVDRGHDVTLLAHPDSRTAGRLIPYSPSGEVIPSTTARAATITRAVIRLRPDVVQSFGRLATIGPVLPWPVAKVMSYQREVTPRAVRWANRLAHGTLSFTGCSRHLIEPVARLARWHVVYNAVPVARYGFTETVPADAPLVFLGRVERIKGPHLALEVARRTGRTLVLAGNVPSDQAAQTYFRTEIEPHIDGTSVAFVGPVDDEQKNALLQSAAALLMPIMWDEPFGIVMAEALACGAPVLGLARGAVPEVIADGRTGFVVKDVDGLVAAVARIPMIDRRACRAAAETRFSPAALVDAYEAIYSDALGAGRAQTRAVAGQLTCTPPA